MKERMLYMRREPASSAVVIYLLAAGLALLPTRWLGELFFPDRANYAYMLGVGVLRLVFFGVVALLARQMGVRRVWLPGGSRADRLLCLPALVIAVNNFPLVALFARTAGVTDPVGALLFAVECIGVGLFEEAAFRALIFPFLLGRTGTGRRGRVIAVLLSSAMFGALHLVNLLGGFSWGVFLQVGYSFLIGCMLAVCMFRGAGALYCAFVHALFNFGGNLVTGARELGFGSFADIWCTEEVILTAVVGVAAIAYFVWALLTARPTAADRFAVFPPEPGTQAPSGQVPQDKSAQVPPETGSPSSPEAGPTSFEAGLQAPPVGGMAEKRTKDKRK